MSRGTWIVLASALALGGCTAMGGRAIESALREDRAAPSALPDRVVATDLVSVLMQLPERSPFATTVQVGPPRTPFGAALLDALRLGGYGVQRVSSDQGRLHVDYRTAQLESERAAITTYALRIGDVELERDYALDSTGTARPVSAVRIRGVDPVRVTVNDDLYRQRGGAGTFVSGVVFHGPDGEVLEARARSVRVNDRAVRAAGERIDAERVLVLARANLFLAERLAADSVPEGMFAPALQGKLRFRERGSLRLGDTNKRALAALVLAFDEATDRVVVTGCSHGESLLWDGSESDALARSQRVKEELLIAGIRSDRIIEEGCFATRHAAELSPDAVIVTLERRQSRL